MAKSQAILERIAKQLGGDAVMTALEQLPPRDLHSLLLHLHAHHAAQKSPQDLLARYAETPAFALAFVESRLGLRFTDAAFSAAEGFTAIELSPVCPLGTIAALSGIHQDWVLSASRGAEVVADPTPVLALECARQRQKARERATPIRLCTSQRLMRMQPVPPGLLPHFRLFGMVTAAQKSRHVETDALREHLAVYLRLFRELETRDFQFDEVTVNVSHTDAVEAWLATQNQDREELRKSVRTQVFGDSDAILKARGLSPIRGRIFEIGDAIAALPTALRGALADIDAHVLAPLAAEFPRAQLRIDLGRIEGLGYYAGPCVRITARDRSGAMLPLVDGGFTRWTQRLLSDSRERFLITGIGSDLACARYVKPASSD